MTKFTLLACLCFLAIYPLRTSGQVEQTLLVEHFTNTRCSICASRNPGFYSNLDNFPEVIHVAYHPSSPYSSCSLNQHNVSGNDERTKYYNVYGSTPRLVIQGSVISPQTDYSGSSLFTSRLGNNVPFRVQFKNANTSSDSIRARIVIGSTEVNSEGSVRLFVVAVEDTIFYNAPNGEKLHHDVYRRTVLDQEISLPGTAGDSVTIPVSTGIHPDWNPDRIYFVAVLQRTDDKSVIQAGSSEEKNGGVLGTEDIITADITLSPNPARDHLRILLPDGKEVNYSVYNMFGQRVLAGNTKESNVVRTESLPAGKYWIRIENDSAQTILLFVVL